MFISVTDNPEMEVWAAMAEGFFSAKCPKYSDNNYEKYVIINIKTHKCSFKRRDYCVGFNEVLFKCEKKDDHIVSSLLSCVIDGPKLKRKVTNYDGEHNILTDGNHMDVDSGLTREYVSSMHFPYFNEAIRGHITNVNELMEAGFYNVMTVRDPYLAIGDFSKIINDVCDDYYPIYIQIPFCEDCNYLFKYQNFSIVDDNKTCINYKFLGIISEGVTLDDIENNRMYKKSHYGRQEFPPFLMSHEVHSMTEVLETATDEMEKVFDLDDFEKYDFETSYVISRFSPKVVIETKHGVFYVVYDRASDLAHLYYSNTKDSAMEQIPGYGDFRSAWGIVKEKLEKFELESTLSE